MTTIEIISLIIGAVSLGFSVISVYIGLKIYQLEIHKIYEHTSSYLNQLSIYLISIKLAAYNMDKEIIELNSERARNILLDLQIHNKDSLFESNVLLCDLKDRRIEIRHEEIKNVLDKGQKTVVDIINACNADKDKLNVYSTFLILRRKKPLNKKDIVSEIMDKLP